MALTIAYAALCAVCVLEYVRLPSWISRPTMCFATITIRSAARGPAAASTASRCWPQLTQTATKSRMRSSAGIGSLSTTQLTAYAGEDSVGGISSAVATRPSRLEPVACPANSTPT
jgi:hypothetical protein